MGLMCPGRLRGEHGRGSRTGGVQEENKMKRKIIGSVLALVALVSAVLFGSKGGGAQGTGSARPGHKPSCTKRDCPGCQP